jgi:hypothetical protein
MTFCKADFVIIKSNYFQKKAMLFGWFWNTSARNLRSGLTVAFAKCHFEVSDLFLFKILNTKFQTQFLSRYRTKPNTAHENKAAFVHLNCIEHTIRVNENFTFLTLTLNNCSKNLACSWMQCFKNVSARKYCSTLLQTKQNYSLP